MGPGGITLTPQGRNGSLVLNGTKLFVSDATSATDLIVAVRTGDGTTDVSLLHVDAKSRGVTTRRLPGFLSWQCEVTFDNVQVPATAMLGEAQRGWTSLSRALERALPLLCSYIVGGCQAVYEKSVLYTQTRVQFGVPIGRFQRVQDHVVKLVNHLDSARWATWEALWKLDTGRPATASVHMAKAVASEAYLEACNAAHEVHAGMGVLVEYGLPRTRRCRGPCSTTSAIRAGTSGGWPTRSSGNQAAGLRARLSRVARRCGSRRPPSPRRSCVRPRRDR